MAVWSEIPLSKSTAAGRADAEYFQPEYLRLERVLRAMGCVRLETVAKVTDGIHASPDVVEDGGITYLSAKCVKDNGFALANTLQISKDQDAGNKRTRLRVDDVLITTVGTIGNAAVVTDDLLPANADRHLGIVRIKPDAGIDPYYLSTFLNSRLGRFQTLREATGNVQLNLFIEKMNTLQVPNLRAQEQVADLTRSAYATRKEAESRFAEAESLLVSALGLNKLDPTPRLFYERSYKDAAKAGRLDAEHFQPKYDNVMEHLHRTKPRHIVPLASILTHCTNGHTPLRHDLSEGDVPFLTAEHVHDFRIDFESPKRVLAGHDQGELRSTSLREGDVLVTIKGKIGNTVVVRNLPGSVNINQDVALLRVSDQVPTAYLAAYLNCVAGRMLIEQASTSQINPFLSLGNLRAIPVPIYSDRQMHEYAQKIEDFVDEADESRSKVKRLLDEAKALVETAVLSGKEASA